jgi:hypothetical protein
MTEPAKPDDKQDDVPKHYIAVISTSDGSDYTNDLGYRTNKSLEKWANHVSAYMHRDAGGSQHSTGNRAYGFHFAGPYFTKQRFRFDSPKAVYDASLTSVILPTDKITAVEIYVVTAEQGKETS